MTAEDNVRIDKWLWAARFFKTRTLAQAAINGGKVKINHTSVKPKYCIKLQDRIEIVRGTERKTIDVLAISTHRGNASLAQQMYQETQASIELREKIALDRLSQPKSHGRPDKKERRSIHRFQKKNDGFMDYPFSEK